MSGDGAGFAIRGGVVCVAAGTAAAIAAAPAGPATLAWVLAGWTVPAAAGLAGGARMAELRGRAGPGFLVALGICMLARLAGVALGAGAAAWVGPAAVGPYLAGLAAGYVPLQAYELVWFVRQPAGRA